MEFNITLPQDVFSILTEKNKNTSEYEFKIMIKQRYLNTDAALKIASIKDIDLIEKKFDKIKFVNLQNTYYIIIEPYRINVDGLNDFFRTEIEDALEVKRCELLYNEDNQAFILAKKMIEEGYNKMLNSSEYPERLLDIAKNNIIETIEKHIKRSIT